MPINLQGSGNIAEGWGGPPQLSAPNIGNLVGEILRNKLLRDKMMQENIADTIKNIQQQRESAAYTEALQKAGLLPEGDYGGLGIKGGESLADMIQRQKAEQALETHRSAMEARIGRGRGGGGGGGGGGEGSAEPQTVWKDGIEWRPGPGGRWIPMKSAGGTKAGEKPTDVAKAVKEELGLQETMVEHDKRIAAERAANIKALKPDVPYSQSDVYNTTKNRLKQLQEIPGMPSTAPAETGDALPTSKVIPSDKAGGQAEGYGVRPSAAILARAQQALDDPEATEEEKAQARKILGQ